MPKYLLTSKKNKKLQYFCEVDMQDILLDIEHF